MKTLKLKLPFKLKNKVLALGAQAKNTICFAQGNSAFISPLHTDLNAPKDIIGFEKDAKCFLRMRPKIIACDLHPEYQSTKFVSQLSALSFQLSAIQHHHAHICACMAENGLKNQKVLGIAFDGTGLGVDGNIWGAEVLSCDYQRFLRLAHLKEIPLVGGERAILEPWRVLAAWLNFSRGVDKQQILSKIYKSGINSPLASSMGRLFDAAACLILGKRKVSFEAELAIELEKLAEASREGDTVFAEGDTVLVEGDTFQQVVNARRKVSPSMRAWKVSPSTRAWKVSPSVVGKDRSEYILDPTGLLRQIIQDLKAKIPRQNIAWRFHQSVAEMVLKISLILRKEHKINKIVLSGGVFQNKILLKLSLDLLLKEDFQVFTHKYLPCNDASISLGQAVIAGYGG